MHYKNKRKLLITIIKSVLELVHEVIRPHLQGICTRCKEYFSHCILFRHHKLGLLFLIA